MDLIFLPVYPRGIEWFKTKTKNTRKCHNSKRNMCEYKYRTKFLREFIFVDFRFFCVFRETNFFRLGQRGFFLLGTFVFTFAADREPR